MCVLNLTRAPVYVAKLGIPRQPTGFGAGGRTCTVARPSVTFRYRKKGKGTVQPLMEVFHGTATECHLPYGIHIYFFKLLININ